MRNDALASKGSLQGIYALQQIINGKTSWKSASKAIWYYPDGGNKWFLGDLKDIGNKSQEIRAYIGNDNMNPSDISTDDWRYYEMNEWKRSYGDIIVQCKNEKGKKNSTLYATLFVLGT